MSAETGNTSQTSTRETLELVGGGGVLIRETTPGPRHASREQFRHRKQLQAASGSQQNEIQPDEGSRHTDQP